ncbi:MAG: 2-succinylbenzoate--CoA ligase [Cyanobacteria bacterium J06600_6]
MKDELLNYLKSSVDQDWLYCSGYDRTLAAKEKNSSLLYRRTQAKLAQISAISAQDYQKPTVLIVEDDPIDFISAFIAGVIAEVHLFLGNPAWQQQEWQQVLNFVQPNLIFGTDAVKSQIYELTSLKLPVTVDANGSLIMIPTGGTSGKIKFAIHSWATLTASVTGFKRFFGCQTVNSWCTLPLYHVSGLMQLMRSLVTRGKLVICPYRLTRPEIERNPSTYFISLVPTQLQLLLDTDPGWLKQFKTVLVGGAPARRSLLERARENRIAIAPIYGSTETASGVVALKPRDFWAGNMSNGQVLPHAQVSIRQISKTNAEIKSDRSIGLISITGTSLFMGYYPQLQTDRRSLTTDDLGYMDTQQNIYLVGRNSHKIITGGENVFPEEVEAAIYATKLVDDVCVFGISDRYWGQAVTAVYVPSSAESNSRLIAQQLQSQLAKYKQPKHWIEVKHIPRNDRGKIDYQRLKAIAISAIPPHKLN